MHVKVHILRMPALYFGKDALHVLEDIPEENYFPSNHWIRQSF
jgi:hypothetical protein